MVGSSFKNMEIKIGAVAIALFLWFHVVTERTYEDTIRVPVKLVGVPKGLVLATAVPRNVRVRVVGKGKRLLALRSANLEARLDLASIRSRRKTFWLKANDVGISPTRGVEVVEIEPDQITITLERFVSREVKVIPALRVVPAKGYVRVGPSQVVPQSVTLAGPERFVARVFTLTTDSLVVEGAKKSIKQTLRVIPPQGVNVNCTPSLVSVYVDIQKLGERSIGGIPVKLLHVPEGFQVHLEPDTVAVTVVGGTDRLASLSPRDFLTWVDYRDIKSFGRSTVSIDLPPDVTLKHIHPKSVKVAGRR